MKVKAMECKNCKKDIMYDSYYHCYNCSCGSVYNAFGQELAPVEDWKDEYEEDYY